MGRAFEKWSDEEFEKLKVTPGRHHDGGGLHIDVKRNGGGAYWYLRYSFAGKPQQHHYGPLHSVTLRQARKQAAQDRALLARCIDPKVARDAHRAATRLAEARQVTFAQAVEAFYAAKRSGWRSEKYAKGWRTMLRIHAEPELGLLPVGAIDTGLVLQVLEPLWNTKTITAGRLRAHLERLLDYAKAREWRTGENPCRWRGCLEHLLPRTRDVAPVKHHPAVPFGDMPVFMAQLRQIEGVVADCLELIALTGTRTNEAREAVWDEIAGNVWIIPKERTKPYRELRVALSPAALAVLDRRRRQSGEAAFIFLGRNNGAPIGEVAVGELLRKLRPGLTVHGLRSSFRDWVAEATAFPGDWAEAAIGHQVGDSVERSYRRGDFLQQRFKLMNAWAAYLSGETADLIAFEERRYG